MSSSLLARAAALCCVVIIGGCASALRPDAPRHVGPITLAPGEHHEDCVRLAAGDRVLFRFEAHPAIAFQVRYRSGEAVIMPVVRPATESDSGFFSAAETHTYCFDWAADATQPLATQLTYHLSLERRQ